MKLIYPNTPELMKSRNLLLQKSLRPEPLPYEISLEYPTILHDSKTQFSKCFIENNQVIAHANLWPRNIIHNQKKQDIKIGLIGNVATHPRCRGKGYMKQLIDQLESHAKQQNLSALFLWSDLIQFYQKLGYKSFNEERHFYLARQKFPQVIDEPVRIRLINQEQSVKDPSQFFKLRYPTNTSTQRSQEDWKSLLSIPDCYCFEITQNQKRVGFFVMGRGYDMAGVIHEWGMDNPDFFESAIRQLFHLAEMEECILLTPKKLKPDWDEKISSLSSESEIQTHALGKILTQDPKKVSMINQLFFWGLDSI